MVDDNGVMQIQIMSDTLAIVTSKPLELSVLNEYNWQKNNTAIEGITFASQCGYTTIAVVLSELISEAKTDKFIADMIAKFEKGFSGGKKSRFASIMDNHVKIYQHYIREYGLNKEVVFIPQDGTLDDIITGLKNGSAVEFSWMPTTSGHFSAIVGYSEIKKAFEIQDPWAKFDFKKKRYTTESGERNWHSISDITPYMNQSSKSKKGYRLIYLKDKI